MSTLLLIRGLPGSGKSTLARSKGAVCIFEADQFFIDQNGQYNFDPSKLGAAHYQCQNRTYGALSVPGDHVVAVANTFTTAWEMDPYKQMAKQLGSKLEILSVFDGGLSDEKLAARNLHSVPVEAITKMRARWQSNV